MCRILIICIFCFALNARASSIDSKYSLQAGENIEISEESIPVFQHHIKRIEGLWHSIKKEKCNSYIKESKAKINVKIFFSQLSKDTTFRSVMWRADIGGHGIIKLFIPAKENESGRDTVALYSDSCSLKGNSDAAARAAILLGKILHVYNRQEAKVDLNNGIYRVNLRAKTESQVIDTRYADIEMERCSGCLTYFYGMLYSKYDLSYKPKLEKDEAIQRTQSIIAEYSDTPPEVLGFNLGQIDNKWVWKTLFSLADERYPGGHSIMISSETGEVVINTLD